MLAKAFIERQVVARRGSQQHPHAHPVRAVLIHQHDRVGRIAKRFGHLPTQFVAHRTGEIHMLERYLLAVIQTGHNHTRHPEENDIGSRHQIGRRIIIADFRIVRLADAIEDLDRPQPGREPGIQNVFVLLEVGHRPSRGFRILGLGLFQSLLRRLGHFHFPVGQVIGRNPMPPPELAGNAPVLDILHPMPVGVLELGRNELDLIVHHHAQSRLGQFFHLEEPLHRKLGLDGHIGTFRIPHIIDVILLFFQQIRLFEVQHDLLAHRKTVHPGVLAAQLVERAVVVEHIQALQLVFHADIVVVDIVGRRNLEASRPEILVHIAVLDHRHFPIHQRHNHMLAAQPVVTLVIRVHADRRIAHDSLRPGRSHNQEAFRIFLDPITQVVQFPLGFLINHFLVRKRRLGLGIPVDHPHPPVNQAALVQVHKDIQNRFRADLVHRETGPGPIAACP